jgi:uncharacterized protein YbcV (DUF1398 family)
MKKIFFIFILLFSLNSLTAFSKASEPDEKSKIEMVLVKADLVSENAEMVKTDFNFKEVLSEFLVQKSHFLNYNKLTEKQTAKKVNDAADVPIIRYCSRNLVTNLYFNTHFDNLYLNFPTDVGWCSETTFLN